jgi:hypothetical protein
MSAWMISATLAEQPKPKEPCETKSSSESIAIVVCAPGLSREAWEAAGRNACGMRSQCNAWIWDNPDYVPDTAPVIDSDLPKKQAGAAVAVWINDTEDMILLKRQ